MLTIYEVLSGSNMKIIVILIFSIFSFSSSAKDFICPAQIFSQENLQKITGWKATLNSINGAKTFSSLGVFDGDPEQGIELTPDNQGKVGRSFWTNTSKQGFWLACYYHNSSIIMVKEIGKTFKKCIKKPRHLLQCR